MLNITCFSLINKHEFWAADRSMLLIKKLLEKVGKIALDSDTSITVTHDISKIEVILSSKV